MTITVHWWVLPLFLVLAGVMIPATFLRSRGDYDMVTPLFGLAIFAACVAGAIGILFGHFSQ